MALLTMSPIDQQIAIAESQRWIDLNITRSCDGGPYILYGKGFTYSPRAMECAPDYLNSHDAMAPVILTILSTKQRYSYMTYLCQVLGIIVPNTRYEGWSFEYEWMIITATPAQQAEAYLKTIGKWRDNLGNRP